MKKCTIICTEKQAFLIELSLDVLSRMCCGQLNESIRGIESMRNKNFPLESIKHYTYVLEQLKIILFPELQSNSSYGVGQKEIGDAQVAYEMVKKLQNFRTRHFKKAGVLKHAPLHYSKEPLIEIKEFKK